MRRRVRVASHRYGFLALFADFIPTALMFMKKVPGLSALLDMAVVKNVRPADNPRRRRRRRGAGGGDTRARARR